MRPTATIRSGIIFFFLQLLTINICFSQNSHPQPLLSPPVADRRIELLSIVFRLAGADEYNNEAFKLYTDAIHRHFDPYKDHPLIKKARQLRDKKGIGFDAVMALAIHLSQPPELAPLVPFSDNVPERRWGKKSALAFTALLRQFYKDADVPSFFDSTAQISSQAAEAAKNTFSQLDVAWYKTYYGTESGNQFHVVLGLGNGGGNYGPKVVYPDGHEDLYAIMGTWNTDINGYAKYDPAQYLPTFIHEFNHSFINLATIPFADRLNNSATTVFNAVRTEMNKQAYGSWQTMINESLVRACVIRYLIQHQATDTEIRLEISTQRTRGWYWISELSDLMARYEQHRDQYPNFSGFMPEIASFYDSLAGVVNNMKDNYLSHCPSVISVEPFTNGATDVTPGTIILKVTFDKPLAGKGYSFNWGKGGGEHFPALKFGSYTDNNTAIQLELKLEPGKDYSMVLTGQSFQTPDGFPLREYELNFSTKK